MNEDDIVLPDLIWEFFQSGSLASFGPGPAVVPTAGAGALLALVFSAAGVATLSRRPRRGDSG